MSIIACPECKKKISSRSAICSFCGFQLGEVTEEDLDIFRARRLRDQIYRMNMISYAVITVFVAAFGWYWWDSGGFTQPSSRGPFILMVTVVTIVQMARSAQPWSAYGLTLRGWRGHALEAVLWTAPALLLLVAVKWADD